jgi:hypothetical protein
MTLKLKILAVLTGISLFLYIIELVRQKGSGRSMPGCGCYRVHDRCAVAVV